MSNTINQNPPAEVSNMAAQAARPQPRAGEARVEAREVKQPEATGGADLTAAVDKINEFIQIAKRNLMFSVDEQTGRTVVTVVNADTKEVVRQIPSEEVLKVAQHLDGLQGLLFKAKA